MHLCIAKHMFHLTAGEMLHAAEPFLENNIHPTVIVRAYFKALEDAIAIVNDMAFPIDINNREQMLNIVQSCIGTKFTTRFGTLMAVRCLSIHYYFVLCMILMCSYVAGAGTGCSALRDGGAGHRPARD